jgi:hypothetical protein
MAVEANHTYSNHDTYAYIRLQGRVHLTGSGLALYNKDRTI